MHTVHRDRHSIREEIYSLPIAFRLRGGISLLQLVRETGYTSPEGALGVAELRSGIAGREGIISAWLEYSREKDAEWGWYFEGPYQGLYLAGSRTRTLEMPINTGDASEACAYFIKAELDSILGREVRLVQASLPANAGP